MSVRAAALQAAAVGLLAIVAGAPSARAQEAEGARPAVAKLLEAAQAQIKEGHYDAAQADLNKADAVRGRTAYESFLIEQTGGVLDQTRGDVDGALKAFRDLLVSGRMPASQKPRLEQTIATLLFQKKDYAGAADFITRAIHDGNKDPALPAELAQAYYEGGDYARAAAVTNAQIKAQAKLHQPPTERQLDTLAACALKQNDDAGYAAALMQLAVHYPSRDVWSNLVTRIQRKPGVSTHYALDLARLKQRLGLLATAQDYEETAQLALADGYPGEALAFIADGAAKGVMGQPADAARQKRLKDYADKQLADDKAKLTQRQASAVDAHGGQDLVRVGYDEVTQGMPDGVALMVQGIKRGELARPQDAQLMLGIAYAKLGQTANAIAELQTVTAPDGLGDMAALWVLALQQGAK